MKIKQEKEEKIKVNFYSPSEPEINSLHISPLELASKSESELELKSDFKFHSRSKQISESDSESVENSYCSFKLDSGSSSDSDFDSSASSISSSDSDYQAKMKKKGATLLKEIKKISNGELSLNLTLDKSLIKLLFEKIKNKKNLITLDLGESTIKPFKELLKFLPNTSISEIILEDTGIKFENVVALMRKLPETKIKKVDLSDNDLSDYRINNLIEELCSSLNLTKLNLSNCEISELTENQELSINLDRVCMEEFRMSGNSFGENKTDLKIRLKNSQFEILALNSNHFGRGGNLIINSDNSYVKHCDLAHNNLDNSLFNNLLYEFTELRIQHLNLAYNTLSLSAVMNIVNHFQKRPLLSLDLNSTELNTESFKELFKYNLSIKKIILSNNHLCPEKNAEITFNLGSELEELSLRGNKIGRKGGHLILNAENSALKKLDLSDNEIGFEGSQISLKSESSQLKELNIDNNPFTPQTLDKFLSGLKRKHNPLNLEFNVFNVKQLREVFLTILAHLKNIPIKKLTFINGHFSNHVGPIYIDLSDTLIEELVLTQLYINEECDVSFNFQNSVIKKINFIGNTLKEKDWDNLACALVGSTIEHLEISFPNTCDQQKDILEGFFKKLANSSVKEIKIYSWGVEPPVLRKIIASFINTQIKHLDIFYQGLMNDSFLKTLTLRLGETPIEKLTLSSSYIDKNWLISLFIHLKGTKVNTLNIDGIVTDKKLKLNTLVKALEETSLTTIKGLGLEDYSEIRKALEKNKNTHVTPCTQILHQPFSLFSIKENPQNIESLKKHPAKPFI